MEIFVIQKVAFGAFVLIVLKILNLRTRLYNYLLFLKTERD